MRKTTAAPEPKSTAFFCCAQGDDDGVVAREDDVDPDDLQQTNPKIGVIQKFHGAFLVIVIKLPCGKTSCL
jgi:hypothetical protein